MADIIEYRYAEEKDISLILSFIKKLAEYEGMPQAVQATEESLREWMFEKKKAEVLFQVFNGIEIGFSLFYEIFPSYIGKGGIFIDDLFIEPEYRKKGFGRYLIGEIAKIALKRNYGRLEWLCLKENIPSVGFYEHIGARLIDECVVFRATGEELENLAMYQLATI